MLKYLDNYFALRMLMYDGFTWNKNNLFKMLKLKWQELISKEHKDIFFEKFNTNLLKSLLKVLCWNYLRKLLEQYNLDMPAVSFRHFAVSYRKLQSGINCFIMSLTYLRFCNSSSYTFQSFMYNRIDFYRNEIK